MSIPMIILISATLLFVGGHFTFSSTGLRGYLIKRLGSEKSYLGLFSVLALSALITMIVAYSNSSIVILWLPPVWLRHLVLTLMPFVIILFVGSLRSDSPTSLDVGQEDIPDQRMGVYIITRHPMLWAFALWAGLHISVNGDLASLVFFGSFLTLGLIGSFAIDAKIRRGRRGYWLTLIGRTSNIPFVGLFTGRCHFNHSLLIPAGFGMGLYIVLIFLHPWLSGVAIIP